MINKDIFIPMLVQIFLTFFLLFRLGFLRIRSLKAGSTKIKDIALGQKNWPEEALKASNSFQNQFEVPLLFYAASLVAIMTQLNSTAYNLLSWVFVLTRIGHAYIHNSSNHVIRRFQFYIVSVGAALGLWIILALNLLK
jgi:hypothetical protein